MVWAVRNRLLDELLQGLFSRECRRNEPLAQAGATARDSPAYIFIEPPFGYRMENGEGPEQEGS